LGVSESVYLDAGFAYTFTAQVQDNTNSQISCTYYMYYADVLIGSLAADTSSFQYFPFTGTAQGTGQNETFAILFNCGSASSSYTSGFFLDSISASAAPS
jgi:hypothetical protein